MDINEINRLKAGTTGRLVVAPSAIVRWVGGEVMVSCVESRKGTSTKDARILQVLHAFAAPRRPQEVFEELKSFGQAFLFTSAAALMQTGVLVEADESDAVPDDDAARVDLARRDAGGEAADDAAQAEAASRTAQEHAQAIARLVWEVACDLGGFGAYAHRGAAAGDGGTSLVARLGGVRRALSTVASELRGLRAPYVAEQLSRLNLSGASCGLKLNLGSGPRRLEGWVNVDVPPADLAMHLGWGLPFGDESVEYVYLSHVLEHLYKQDALELLREAHRVLAPAGVLRVVVPDVEKCLRAYAEKDEGFFATRRRLWARSTGSSETALELVLKNAGAGVKPWRFWGHKHGYDFETLGHVLRKAGFARVERSEYMESAHAALRVDTTARTAGFKHEGDYYSLFVEAVK